MVRRTSSMVHRIRFMVCSMDQRTCMDVRTCSMARERVLWNMTHVLWTIGHVLYVLMDPRTCSTGLHGPLPYMQGRTPPDLPPRGQGPSPRRPPCAQARMARTAREHEDLMARNMMSKGNHKRGGAAEGRASSFVVAARGRHLCILALNRVNIIAVTTTLVLHVRVIGHHVPRHLGFMSPRHSGHARLRARGVKGALPPGRGV